MCKVDLTNINNEVITYKPRIICNYLAFQNTN